MASGADKLRVSFRYKGAHGRVNITPGVSAPNLLFQLQVVVSSGI